MRWCHLGVPGYQYSDKTRKCTLAYVLYTCRIISQDIKASVCHQKRLMDNLLLFLSFQDGNRMPRKPTSYTLEKLHFQKSVTLFKSPWCCYLPITSKRFPLLWVSQYTVYTVTFIGYQIEPLFPSACNPPRLRPDWHGYKGSAPQFQCSMSILHPINSETQRKMWLSTKGSGQSSVRLFDISEDRRIKPCLFVPTRAIA